eukprot:1635667-Ditylum_brightwellii.AAC.2
MVAKHHYFLTWEKMIQLLTAPSLAKLGAFTSLFHVGLTIRTKVLYITKKLLNPETNKFKLSRKK